MLKINKSDKSLLGEIQLPVSKSIRNRMLIIQYLSGADLDEGQLSEADDSALLFSILNDLKNDPENYKSEVIDVKNAGTVARFMTALLTLIPGEFTLIGDERMQERPINILVESLQKLGANIEYLDEEGFFPIKIHQTKLTNDSVSLDASVSSQFVSALMLIAPYLENGLEIKLENKISSFPYIEMTAALMRKCGIEVSIIDNIVDVSSGKYSVPESFTEFDWSSAAFWFQMVAFSDNGEILLKGLTPNSVQGDSVLIDIFENLGVDSFFNEDGLLLTNHGNINFHFNYDFTNCPDLALPVIACCAGLGVNGKFTGLQSLRIKESDRIAALEKELAKFNFDFRETDDDEYVLLQACLYDCVNERKIKPNVQIETYNDHRVAMSFAPFVLLCKELYIQNPEVVGKSYPTFWDDLRLVGFDLLADE